MHLPENTVLKKAILKEASSVRKYCKKTGFGYQSVLRLIQLRDLPTEKGSKEKYRHICKQLSIAFGIPLHRLFPMRIYAADYYAEQINAAMAAQPPSVDAEEAAASHASSPDVIYEAKKQLKAALACLSEREAMFLVKYYILEKTLKEIGEAEGISIERARQIIKRAVNKIKRKRR